MKVVIDVQSRKRVQSAISRSDCPPGYQPFLTPRNSNLQQRQHQKSRLTHDAIHELAYDLDGFVKIITTYPDLVVVCGLDSITKDLDNILMADSVVVI